VVLDDGKATDVPHGLGEALDGADEYDPEADSGVRGAA
jgi:cell division transport system ATP-binding protein